MIVVIILDLNLHARFARPIRELNPYRAGTKVLTFPISLHPLHLSILTTQLFQFVKGPITQAAPYHCIYPVVYRENVPALTLFVEL